jgi:serine O-acetyltransferase
VKIKSRIMSEANLKSFWKHVIQDAKNIAEAEPMLSSTIHSRLVQHDSFGCALAQILAVKLGDQDLDALKLQNLFQGIFAKNESIVAQASADAQSYVDRDPACKSLVEPILFFKGFQALQAHRIAHYLWKKKRTFLAQFIQSAVSKCFSVDIHPAAPFGSGILIDHATNLVVGETAKVGHNVSILHGVTLGGTGKDVGDRHPKIADGVLLSAHAQLIGNIKVGKGAKIGAGAVVLTNVPAHTTYAGVPAKQVGVPECEMPATEMNAAFGLEE